MSKNVKPVIVYGTTVIAKMLFFDSADNPDFHIAAFAADPEYVSGDSFLSVPLIPFDQVEQIYSPENFDMIAAVAGSSDMRGHAAYYLRAKAKGYTIRKYVSQRAVVTLGTKMGENSIVFPFAYIGPEGVIEENVIIRQNAYLGHNIGVGSHSFIGVGCQIGGGCKVGSFSYLSIGSTITDHIVLGRETLVGAGSVVINDTLPFSKVVGNPARLIGTHKDEGIKISARN
jgi:UDP-3-O-[3-hydroxymyristoyl] glucosamine N-acyltransferase